MLELNSALAIGPLVIGFAASVLAELALLSSDKRLVIAVAKSAKAIIIPALIATYALIIANIIGVGDVNQ